MDKEARIFCLEDAISTAVDTLTKARFLLQEILEGYFEAFDPTTQEGRTAILYDWERRKAFSQILHGLLWEVTSELRKAAEDETTREAEV